MDEVLQDVVQAVKQAQQAWQVETVQQSVDVHPGIS